MHVVTRSRSFLLSLLLLAAACTPPGPLTRPNEKEWNVIVADYQWLNTLRGSQKQPAANAPRKAQLEQLIENHNKIEPTYVAFVEKVR